MSEQKTQLIVLLQPLIDEYGIGDTEHAGMDVVATLKLFCLTGEVRVNWRNQEGSYDYDALRRLGV